MTTVEPRGRAGRYAPGVATVEVATEATDELVAALARLLPQLSQSAPAPTPAEVAEMVASPTTTVFVARGDDGGIIGTLTLATFRIPSGIRAWIEDVVVDDAARGQGAGAALTRAALAKAADLGARTVELTSRASRVAANQLYQRLGFAAAPDQRLPLPAPRVRRGPAACGVGHRPTGRAVSGGIPAVTSHSKRPSIP